MLWKTSYLLQSLFLFQSFVNVYGWGPVGHRIIVRLAQSHLDDCTVEWIRSLTPWHWNGDLSAMASWADDILYDDSNPTGYGNWQWTRPLHYINTPDWNCSYHADRDCIADNCIFGAIKNYTQRLETEYDEIQLKEALYFLIHYVGDIHQPLHVGFTNDRGGNSIRGKYMNRTAITNLHTMWDSGLITTRLQRDFQSNTSSYYDYIYEIMQNQSVAENDNDVLQWINEDINFVCSQIYIDENNATMNSSVNFTLGEIYYQRNIPIIEQRLAQGGRRLGVLLNLITKNHRKNSPDKKKEKLCPGTIALIAILGAELVIGIIIGAISWVRYKRKSSSGSHSFSYTPQQT